MKKIFLVLSLAFLLAQFSCSSNQSSTNFELYLIDAPAHNL